MIGLWQVIDPFTGNIIMQGTRQQCETYQRTMAPQCVVQPKTGY